MPPTVRRHSYRLVALIAAFPLSLAAQNSSGRSGPAADAASHATHAIPTPSAHAAHRSGPVVVDGKLDEAAWQSATPITEFKQNDPDIGQPSSERIDVRFLYDDDALYVGAKLYDKLGAAGVTSTVVRRDAFFNSDYFEIVIDGFHDHLGRAFFQVNPSGSKTDLIGIGTSCCDDGWDPVWDAVTHIDNDGWTAEIRIPYSQLRFSRDSVQLWGLQVRRYIKRRNETDQWSYWGKDENGGPSRFGHLDGIRIPSAPRHLELLPYVAAKSNNTAAAPGDPFNDGSKQSARLGLDIKSLLTTNLTLDATINPDFGQVEVDPAVVNLSAYETFYQERRPFFVSGAGVFNFGSFSCFFCSNVSSLQAFYSRRIGRPPTGSDLAYNKGPYADVPDATTILGAAKITGRTQNGYTVGLLNAVTGKANADVQLAGGARTTQEVEPLTNYFVGRLKRDYMGGNLVVGGILTSTIRDLDSTFTPRLSKHAELLGGDFQYTWKNKTYSLIGNAAVSSVTGDSQVILAKQLASARYYQRPDRGARSSGFFSTQLDSSATSMHGLGGYLRLAKDQGKSWFWETSVNMRTASFETNDYSFLTNADYIWNNANVMRMWQTPTSWYRNFSIIVGGQEQHNFDGDRTQGSQAQIYLQTQTPQFWNASTFYIWYPKGNYDDRLLRGGPSVRIPGSGYYSFNVNTDSRKQWQLNGNGSWSWNDDNGWGRNYSVSVSFQPSSRVYVSVGPNYYEGNGKFQYVQKISDATATAFNGTRYLLSDLMQHQLNFDTRLNVTFSPTMTLEIYAQPYLSSAQYHDFKEFNAPRTQAYSVYGRDAGTVTPTLDAKGHVTSYAIDPDGAGAAPAFTIQNPDFNFRSLRGNAVFRWEYRPGSTLYVAWTQERSDMAAIGSFDAHRDGQAMVDAHPDNIFLVKASWWLAR